MFPQSLAGGSSTLKFPRPIPSAIDSLDIAFYPALPPHMVFARDSFRVGFDANSINPMLEARLLATIGTIYDTAANPALWPVFFQHYAEMVPADYLCIQLHDHRHEQSRFLASYENGVTFQEAYHEYRHRNRPNIWRKRGKRLFESGSLLPSETHIPTDLLQRCEYYNHLLKPEGARHSFNAVISRDEERAAIFSLSRADRYGPYDESAVRITQSLIPHLKGAINIQRRLATLTAGEEALNQLPVGVAYLASDARLVFTNAAADAMIRRGDALAVDNSMLRATDPIGDATLQHAIAELGPPAKSSSTPAIILLERGSPRRPLKLALSSVTNPFSQFIGTWAPAVVAIITDPGDDVEVDEDILMNALHLTRAESRVAALLFNGGSTSDIADRLAVQENTVRVHLKSIFAKTGTHSQAELIRLLLTASSGPVL